MPRHAYAFEPNGTKRLELSWGLFWKNFTISLDGQQVATLQPADVKQGHEVPLPDGTTLRVQLKRGFANAGLEVLRNGQPLPGTSTDPATQVKTAGYVLYFLGAVHSLVGAVALAFDVRILLKLGFGLSTIGFGFVFALSGFFTLKRSQAALITGITLYALDYVVGLVWSLAAGGRPSLGGIGVRILFIVIMARGIGGIRALKARAP